MGAGYRCGAHAGRANALSSFSVVGGNDGSFAAGMQTVALIRSAMRAVRAAGHQTAGVKAAAWRLIRRRPPPGRHRLPMQ